MTNNENQAIGYVLNGGLLDRPDADQIMENFTWASMLMLLFYIHAGPMPTIQSVDDFKKAVSSFNDSIQAMELPDLEGIKDEL